MLIHSHSFAHISRRNNFWILYTVKLAIGLAFVVFNIGSDDVPNIGLLDRRHGIFLIRNKCFFQSIPVSLDILLIYVVFDEHNVHAAAKHYDNQCDNSNCVHHVLLWTIGDHWLQNGCQCDVQWTMVSISEHRAKIHHINLGTLTTINRFHRIENVSLHIGHFH